LDNTEKLFSVGVTFNKRLYDSEHQEIVESMYMTYPNMDFHVFHENKFEMERYGDSGVQLIEREHLYTHDIFELNEWLPDFLNNSPFKDSHKIGTVGTFDPPHYWKRNGIFWFRKAVAITSLIDLNLIKTPYLIWVGCDTRWNKKIDDDFYDHIVKYDICHIDRKPLGLYTETDIMIFDLRNNLVKDFIQGYKEHYLSGTVFKEERWDDCVAFDRTKERFIDKLEFGSLLNKTGCPFNVYDYLFHWKYPLHKIRDEREGV